MVSDTTSSSSQSRDSGAGSTPQRRPSSSRGGLPSANPLPLSASQEAQVRDLYYERVRQQCQAEIRDFAECALGRTFSVVFRCRDKNTAMNGCLRAHATGQALDEAREEWFARREERAAERARKAARKAEQEALLRAWWGLEDGDATAAHPDIQAQRRRLAEERLQRPERIGGKPAKDRPRFGGDTGKTDSG